MYERFLVLMLAAFFSLSGVGAADKVTLTGIVSDEICDSKHYIPNLDAAGCTHECVLHGADYVLVAKDKVYTLKPDNTQALADLDTLAGKSVVVNGEPEKDFIWVLTVTAAK